MLFLTMTMAAHRPNNDGDDVDSFDERKIPITTILYNARQKKRGRGWEEGLCFGEGIEWKRQGHAFYKLLISVFKIEKKLHNTKYPKVTCPGFPGYCSESYPGDVCLVVCAFGRNNVPQCQVCYIFFQLSFPFL